MADKLFTRRDFLKTCGKGVSLLALFSGVIRFDAPARAESEKPLFANDLIRGEDQLKVIFLEKKHPEKSDAFFILYLSENGLDITLHDGGFDDSNTYKALSNLRKEILDSAGVADTPGAYRLNMRLVISHFHTDHVQGLNGMILRTNRKFAISEVYAPPATCLPLGIYDDAENSDVVERPDFMYAMKTYHPDTPIHILDYGETCLVPTDIGEMRLFAPVNDWGTDEKIKMFSHVYGYKDRYNYLEAIPICAVNANSLWMRVALDDYSFLFTGDVEKRNEDRLDEPMDEMIAEYGEALRSDIIKYPHHGQIRDAAAKIIRRKLITKKEQAICILTASDGWQDAGVALSRLSMRWFDLEKGSILYTVKNNAISHQVVKGATAFL